MGEGVSWKRALLVFVVALAALTLIEQLRSIDDSKWNDNLGDATYYTAMAEAGVRNPEPVIVWLEDPDYFHMVEDVGVRYEHERYTSYLNYENGFANQPPYVQRILVPTAVGVLDDLGVPGSWGLLHVLGLAGFAVGVYRLLRYDFRWDRVAAAGAAFSTLAIVAVEDSVRTPDGAWAFLAIAAVVASAERRLWLFVLTATLATLTRETGLLLALVWPLMVGGSESDRRRWLPALAPVASFVLVQGWIVVPNSTVNFRALVDAALTPEAVVTWVAGLVALVGATCAASFPGARVTTPAVMLFSAAVVGSAAMTTVATNTARTTALVIPVLWAVVPVLRRTGPWIVYAIGGLSFAVAAQAAGRGLVDPEVIWPVAALVCIAAFGIIWRRGDFSSQLITHPRHEPEHPLIAR